MLKALETYSGHQIRIATPSKMTEFSTLQTNTVTLTIHLYEDVHFETL